MILYLHGFASGPRSSKGVALARRFAQLGIPFHLADLTPGADGFERATPVTMLEEARRLAEALHPRVVMGSSLGGWLAAVMTLEDPSIERLVLLAPAFRLRDRWLERLAPDELERWRRDGLVVQHHATDRARTVPWSFMEDAAKLPAFPQVAVPTLCVAGRRDDVVPLEDVQAFVTWNPTASLVTVDDGHELSGSVDRIFEEALAFLKPVYG